jgi:hypothetical protein
MSAAVNSRRVFLRSRWSISRARSFLLFIEPEGSSYCSQQSPVNPVLTPLNIQSTHTHTHKDSFSYYRPFVTNDLFQIFRLKFDMRFYFPYTCYMSRACIPWFYDPNIRWIMQIRKPLILYIRNLRNNHMECSVLRNFKRVASKDLTIYNSTEQNPSREANSRIAGEEIPCLIVKTESVWYTVVFTRTFHSTESYSEPAEFSLYSHIPFPYDPF